MIAVALLLFVSAANALPTGAPTKACQTMLPFHGGGIPRQLGPSPFGVTTTRSNGDVVVSIRSPIEQPFEGLMLQARLRSGELGGVFEPITQNVHTIDCDHPGDTITHDNTKQKTAVEVRWKPPAGYLGPVIFNATIAQEYSTFWVGVQSEPLRISQRFQDEDQSAPSSPRVFTSTPPHFIPESMTAAPIKSDRFYDGCGTRKLCFGMPDGCIAQQNCKAVAAVTVSGDRYEFEMKALENPVWVGVGLSSDNRMGDDSVLECVKEGNSVKPYLSWTSPRPNLGVERIANPQSGIQLLNSSVVDDTMYCKVLRNPKTVINGIEFDLVNTKYYLLVAAGQRFRENGDISFHTIGQRASATDGYLSDITGVPESTTTAPVIYDPFYDGCEIGKLCFGMPDGCIAQQNCKAVVAVTVIGERYEFEMKALENPVWVGVGLSSDNRMGDDSVLECVKEGNSVKPYLSWTSPRPNLGVERIANPQYGIELLNSSVVDDTMYCKVFRNTKTVINGMEFDLVNTKYYLLIAAGQRFRENGDIDFHTIGQQASATDRYLSDISSVKGASKLLLRLHGAFMLAAWIGTASLGTFMARYYRKTWVGKTICGKDLWFAWHRFFMVLTWALTTVAFVLIFVELKAWTTETSNPHAILGCIVTALCFMQPIGAFFRPHPGTSKRPIFNWIHWFGGNAAHIIAIVTIFFAVKLNKAELPEWFDKILAAYVAFHVLMHLVLSILGCVSDNSSNQRVTAFPMKDLTNSGKMSGQMVNVDAPLSGARKILLGFYILIVATLTAVLIVLIALAPIET